MHKGFPSARHIKNALDFRKKARAFFISGFALYRSETCFNRVALQSLIHMGGEKFFHFIPI